MERINKKLGDAQNIQRVESFGALLALELDGFSLAQHLVSLRENGGEMNEDIFSAGALDESETLGSVEPFDDTLLFHARSPCGVAAITSAPGRKRRKPPART
jgi:hypothetical protein